MRDYTNTPLQLYAGDFTLKAAIDVYDSLVWTDVYCGYGDFELKIQHKIASKYGIQIGDYLQCFLSEKVMIVEGMSLDYGSQNEVTVTYKGRSLESILIRRVMRREDLPKIVPQIDGGSYVPAEIRGLWDSIQYVLERTIVQNSSASGGHAGLSSDPRGVRSLGYITPTDEEFIDPSTPYVNFDGISVYDYICSVLSYFGFGFAISFNNAGVIDSDNSTINNRKMMFSVYNGKKRTYNQIENERVYFSTDDDSTFKMDTSIDMENYGNVALVVGPHPCAIIYDENEDKQLVEVPSVRYTTDIYNAVSGLDRYEVFVDCSSVPNSDTSREIPYSEDYIVAQMRFNAIQVVKGKMSANITYDPSVDFDPYKEYGVHYYLGDLCNALDDFGNITIVRIDSFSQSIDSSGYKGYPHFASVSPIGGYRVIEQTEGGSDVARALEDNTNVRVTEQNNLELFEDTSGI